MTTHVRSAANPPFKTLTATLLARFKAWRAQRAERAQIEALEALGPEILDDVGIRIVRADRAANFIPVFNPYGIVAAAVFAPQPAERDEF